MLDEVVFQAFVRADVVVAHESGDVGVALPGM